MEFIKFTFQSFWHFAGMFLLISTVLLISVNGTVRILNRLFRHLNIRKHGWPPPYIDADGDSIYETPDDTDSI
jgi:hypothetical protein